MRAPCRAHDDTPVAVCQRSSVRFQMVVERTDVKLTTQHAGRRQLHTRGWGDLEAVEDPGHAERDDHVGVER